MADNMIEILRNHLSYKDDSLREWMLELLSFSQNAAGLKQALDRLVPLRNELSSSIDFISKVPYCSLLLSYVYYRWNNFSSSASWAEDAIIKGFGNDCEAQNHAVALWLHGLANEQANDIEKAQRDLNDAIKLIEREVSNCKRRGKWTQQKKYEAMIKQLCETTNRLTNEFRCYWGP